MYIYIIYLLPKIAWCTQLHSEWTIEKCMYACQRARNERCIDVWKKRESEREGDRGV